MAKTQGLHLNPGKISGLCGRLMCCLEYENPYYQEVVQKMPKLNSEVKTPEGVGVVQYTNAPMSDSCCGSDCDIAVT